MRRRVLQIKFGPLVHHACFVIGRDSRTAQCEVVAEARVSQQILLQLLLDAASFFFPFGQIFGACVKALVQALEEVVSGRVLCLARSLHLSIGQLLNELFPRLELILYRALLFADLL